MTAITVVNFVCFLGFLCLYTAAIWWFIQHLFR